MPISPPTKITVPFATSGLKNAIPANTDNVTGKAGYDAGFGAINMTPKTAGGIPPFGQDFNGIFFDVTTAIQFLEAGGAFPYDSAFATDVGGYPLGALVSRTDGSGLWRNIVVNNTTNPETFGAGWQPEDAGSAAVTMTNTNVTLTALQAARSIIVITGVLTANLNLIFPVYVKQWLIVNNCTGAFTVTAKTASGSGVSIKTLSSQTVYGDGVNISSTQSGGVAFKNVQIYATAGSFTWTVPAGVTSCLAYATGGGGGGGGSTSATGAAGGGGGGGATGIRLCDLTGVSTVTVTVGAAGAAGAAGGSGGNGGSTSFGAFIAAGGGNGGPGSTGGQTFSGSGSAAGSGGDTNLPGAAGKFSSVTNGVFSAAGPGGDSFFGRGFGAPLVVGTTPSGVAGFAGTLGAGGSGGASYNATATGGVGSPGYVVIYY